MKARRAVLKGVRHLEFEEIELPAEPLAESAVLARTEFSAVSTGTEVAAYTGEPPLRPGPIYPRKVGYCNVAQVVAVGAGVKTVVPGQRILTAQSHQSAFVCGEAEVLAAVPPAVSPEAATLTYLAQLGLAALQTGSFRAGEKVAVLGLGVIGLATIVMSATYGAKVIAIGNDRARVALAERLGAHAGFLSSDPQLLGEAPDLIVTTANSWSAWKLALELARFHTRLAVLGFPGRSEGAPDFNPLDAAHFYDKQLSIFAAGLREEPGGDRKLLRANLALILDGLAGAQPLPLAELITHRLPWHLLGALYELAAARDKSLVAGILDWTSAA